MPERVKPPYVGAAYYPEVFGRELYAEDIRLMKEAGVNCVRIAEFAWSSMEPEEGKFDFFWLHEIADRLFENGIGIVLCTPSATPPKWLTDKYPETLFFYENGERVSHGARCHVCKTSPKMREKNRIIVTRMCREFAGHPGIVGWQIDNEIYPYNNGCFCPACRKAFAGYLKEKYGTVSELNRAWGNARWSMEYDDFEGILPPRTDRWNHPSLETEWKAFHARQITSYVAEQAEIIRRSFRVPVGTDMMPMLGTDYYRLYEHLDVVQYNHYDTEEGLQSQAFWYDFLRPVKDRPFWVTETQNGWSGAKAVFNGYRHPGNGKVNAWLAFAKGAEANMYWHFRAHRAGHELHHGALYTTDGRMQCYTKEVAELSKDLEKAAPYLSGTKVKSKIALSLSSESWRHLESAPYLENFKYVETVRDRFHGALRHRNIDVIDTAHPLDGYDVVISPFLTDANADGFREKVLSFTENGGKWIAGPLTDIYTDYAAKFGKGPTSFLEETAGVYVKYVVPQDADDLAISGKDGRKRAGSLYFEGYEMRGAESLADYTSSWLKGLSAAAERKIGKGSIVIVGTVPDAEWLSDLCGVPPVFRASDNVEVIEREGTAGRAVFVLETMNRPGRVTLDGTYTDVLSGGAFAGEVNLAPYTVLLLIPKEGKGQ